MFDVKVFQHFGCTPSMNKYEIELNIHANIEKGEKRLTVNLAIIKREPMHWGKAIKALREKVGMKQVELARAVSISKTSMSLIESGKSSPSEDTVREIASVFDLDVSYIELLAVGMGKMGDTTRAMFDEFFPELESRILSLVVKKYKYQNKRILRNDSRKGCRLS